MFAISLAAHARHQAARRRLGNRGLLDATVIRGVLLPATMKMLGEWNWYLPRWLGWLPHVRREAAVVRPLAEAA